MSNSPDENSDDAPDDTGLGITDDQLPEDLVPGEDNPLAAGLDDGETVDDLMQGKPPEQSGDSEQSGASGDSGSSGSSESSAADSRD